MKFSIWFISIYLNFSFVFHLVKSKTISRCELAIELRKHLNDEQWKRLEDWICAADALSGLDTSLNTTNPSDLTSKSYGLYQVNNQWWCEDDLSFKGNPAFPNLCGEKCADLINDDLTNDIQCAIKIQRSGTDGPFGAWYGWVANCKGKNLDQYKYLDNCAVTAQPTVPQVNITKTNVTFVEGDSNQYMYCSGFGTPSPVMSWMFDQNAFSELKTQKIISEPSTVRLIFPKVKSFYAGSYKCIAKNFFGETSHTYHLNVTPNPETSFPYGIVIGVSIGILAFGVLIAVIYFRRLLLKLDGLTKAEIREFLNGCPEKLVQASKNMKDDAQNGVNHENIQNLPYDKSYDILKDKIKLENSKIIGEGQYGYVSKVQLDGQPVAVKAVKPHTDKLYIKALLSELKIMIYLRKHENIVSLIGAVTSELEIGMLLIVVEFCDMGDLQNYLRNHKNNFVSIKQEEEQQERQQQQQSSSMNLEYANTSPTKITTTIREYENTNSLTTADLIQWCSEIANGMQYLESKKVIHGDLAARNVLLTNDYQAKITDFGLSRQLYDYTIYVKKQQAPLPWRHMAIESLKEMSFSSESDVWAFGVTMWEIFSLGDVPYPGRSWSLDFVHELENGLRLLQPKHAPDFIYERMKACWNLNTHDRPSFQSLTNLGD